MIDELYEYYRNNLTFYSRVIKQIPWFLRYTIFASYVIANISILTTLWLPIIIPFESPSFSMWMYILITVDVIFALIFCVLYRFYVFKIIRTKFYNAYIKEKYSWSKSKFNLYLLHDLQNYLIENEFNFDKFNILIEAIENQIKRARRIETSFFITFGILIIPVWEKIVDCIQEWFTIRGVNLVYGFIFLIIGILLLSWLRKKIEFFNSQALFIRHVKLDNLKEMLLELQLKDYKFPKKWKRD